MKRILPVLALVATPALAQDTQEERDRGFLVGLIEDNLSAPGLQVRLEGFEGALSSTASLDELTVADDEGVWLRLQDVVLDWNRSALLRGRLEVEALTAALIEVRRAPLPAEGVEALPDAAATPFALPDLPVSVQIDVLRADRIELGETLLGQDLAMTLEATAALADGSGSVDLLGRRLDGVEGVFDIAASFDAESTALAVDLDVREAQGGIASTLLGLPGAPAIELTVAGEGPLDAFSADIALMSDGAPRLAGAVSLSGVDEGRRFDVDLGGDLTALLAPEYRPFFGDDVGVAATGLLRDAGGILLDDLSVDTRALTLEGNAEIGADGWPTVLDIEGRLAAQDGGPVLLPVETEITVAGATFTLQHDAAIAEDWSLDLIVDGLSHPALDAASAQITADGAISRTDGAVTGALADLAIDASGLAFDDPALQQAVGSQATVSARVDYASGQPIRVENLMLRGPALEADGGIAFDSTAELPLSLDLTARIAALSDLSGLTGQDGLEGAAEVRVGGAAALGGAFELDVAGAATGLVIGIPQADALLGGRTDLAVRARRDETGTFLDALDLSNPQLQVTGDAALFAEEAPQRAEGRTSQASLVVVLADGSEIDPRLAGETRATVSVSQDESGAFAGSARIEAPEGVELQAEGVLTGPGGDVNFALTVPALEPFAPGVPGGVTAEGRAFKDAQGDWRVDADATGPYDVTASVIGVVTGERLDVEYEASLPDPTAAVPALEAVPALAGPVELAGSVRQQGGVLVTDTRVDAPQGVVLRIAGPVTGDAPRIDVALTVPEIEAFVPQVEGALSIDGTAAQLDGVWNIDARASGPYAATATVETALAEGPLSVDFTLAVPELSEIVAAVPGAVTLDGTAVQEAEGWRVDVDGTGPYGAVLDVMARLPEAGPEIVAQIRIPDATALDPRLTGALAVDLDARQVDGVWSADLDASGPLDASLTAEATLGDDEANIVADLRIPDSSVLTPRLSGPLNVDLDATQVAGVWTASFDASGPLGASAVGEARLAGQDAEIDFDLRVPDSSVLTPQLNGPLNADVSARQVDGVWTVEADSRGPFGGTIQANARLDGAEADVNATVALPDVSRAVPQLSGPLNATIAATQRGGVWSADVDAGGPLGATLDVSGVVYGGPVDVVVDLSVPDISPLVPDLSGPLGVSGTVAQAGEAYRLDLDLTGPAGTQASVAGTAATDLTLDLSVTGSAPLGLANPFLGPQRLDGTVGFDLNVAGPPALGSVSGTVSTQGTAVVLPTLRNQLDPVNATITIAGGQATVQATAALASGGEVQINGPIALTAPFNADLGVTFDVTLEDPSLYTAQAQGALTITGPLTGGAVIGGEIVIPSAEIAVPSTGITAVGDLPPITHLGATRPVQRTLARAGQDAASLAEDQAQTASAGPGFGLDIVIRAPGRVFVRGRGLDAELGGEIFLTGSTNQVITAGGFELVRGRLDILQQRFLFDEGRVTFQGDLVPYVRLVAETETDTLTAFIVVEGPVDDIAVRFDSAPEVPQEEVLAQIFFGRDLTELSPLQALQLANSVATLAGRGSGGVLERLRSGAGLDDLDVTTDAEGNTAVRAGKYISDNVYTTVQIDQAGEAEISLNLDVSPNLTIRGTTGAAGESTVGVFFERDY